MPNQNELVPNEQELKAANEVLDVAYAKHEELSGSGKNVEAECGCLLAKFTRHFTGPDDKVGKSATELAGELTITHDQHKMTELQRQCEEQAALLDDIKQALENDSTTTFLEAYDKVSELLKQSQSTSLALHDSSLTKRVLEEAIAKLDVEDIKNFNSNWRNGFAHATEIIAELASTL